MQFHVHPLTPCGIQGLTSAVCPLSRQFEPFSHGFFSFLFSSDFPFLPLVAGGRAAGLNCSHVPPSQGGFHRFHSVSLNPLSFKLACWSSCPLQKHAAISSLLPQPVGDACTTASNSAAFICITVAWGWLARNQKPLQMAQRRQPSVSFSHSVSLF